MLRLGDHSPLAAPAVLCGVEEFGEDPGGHLGFPVLFLRVCHLPVDLLAQTRILCQPKYIDEAFAITPGHQLFPAEASVAPDPYLHLGPTLANARHHGG